MNHNILSLHLHQPIENNPQHSLTIELMYHWSYPYSAMSSKTPMYKLLLIDHTKSGKGTPFRFSMKFISNKVLSSTKELIQN